MPTPSLTRALCVTEAGPARIPLACGLRAGPWLFVAGLLPDDLLMDDLGQSGRPRSGEPPWLRQASSIWQSAAEILHVGGADLSRIVRCDQFFVDWRAVPFFHQARRKACGSYIAPSTSILQPEMLVPGAAMMTDMIAVAADGPAVEPIFPDGLDIPSTSSFVPVVRAGHLVFVAGFLAAHGPGDLGGIAPAAKVPEGHLWKGNRIELEAKYLIREKLVPALAGAGLGLADVVKANVFLSDIDDVPAFNQVWAETFAGSVPATTIVPTSKPGFAIADARMEINLVATTERAQTVRVDGGRAADTVCDGHPVALRLGDFLLFSGLMAADRNGLIAAARVEDRDRYLASSIEAQMEYLLDLAEEVCEQSGASLRNVARILQVHTDLADFLPACRVWQRRLPGLPLPISAVRVPAPLIVPGCAVQLDLWIYAP
jgi:enamine deaminase RidA (YjgF/YER057c/UK114 family)